MTLYDELYFEITLKGRKCDLNKFVAFLKSGELDDFFEFSRDYIFASDNYETRALYEEAKIVLSNDDYGIEIDEFDVDEFLDVFCRAAKALDVNGQLFDAENDEYHFISEPGSSYYLNAKNISIFNEDEDREAEDGDEDEEED